jgi:hypothetical protein
MLTALPAADRQLIKQEYFMAKGQMRSNREAKKPKKDKAAAGKGAAMPAKKK